MDEKTNKRIEELKKRPLHWVLPLVLLFFVLIGLFFYRVAVTAPGWDPVPPPSQEPATSKNTSVEPPPKSGSQTVSKKTSPTPYAVVPTPRTRPTARPRPVATEPAAATEPADRTAAATVPAETTTPADADAAPEASAPAPETAPAASDLADDIALDDYLKKHRNRPVPFLYKGEKRMVTLVDFSDETVTIKRKKSFTMKRSDLSAEQRALWK